VSGAIVALVLVSLPPRPQSITGADASLLGRTVSGAFHVHTTRSDGLGDKASVAAAARGAGLKFVAFTDHGDGTRTPDSPQYIDGVLCLDGVEISTADGHYIALGAAPSAYPLGGDSAGVVEDVARLGGFGVAAHPFSARPELAWRDWNPPVDGLEWLNADSEWRDEGRWQLARALSTYLVRSAGALASLLDRPESALARWDAIAASRPILAIAGHDAHGGIGGGLEQPSGRRVRIPSYKATFRTFSVRAVVDRPLTGDAAADGNAVLGALRGGSFYTEISAVAEGSTLAFSARTAGATVAQGGVLTSTAAATFSAHAAVPDEGTIVALRNGVEVARAAGGSIQFQAGEPGAFRIEVRVASAPGQPPVPWLVSNPIFRLPPVATTTATEPSTVLALPATGWRIEHSEGSEGSAQTASSGEVEFRYRLRGEPRASQFVALVHDLPASLPPFDAIAFTARAGAPRRVSVQLRFAKDGDARWGKSAYVGERLAPIVVPVTAMRRADGTAQRPDTGRATSLLFVIDLTNAFPGDAQTIHVAELRLVR
jgi:hypothetical protein